MSKHTPGPWENSDESEGGEDWYREYLQIGPARIDIGRGPADPEDRANARLIAAAPELLEALKWFVSNDDTNEGDEPMPKYGGQSWNEINAFWIDGLNRARAAIAKAEGEEA